MISNTTGYEYKVDSEGYVYQGDEIKRHKKLSPTLNSVVKSAIDSSEEYEIEVVGEKYDEDVLIDSFANRQVDISDLQKANRCDRALAGALIGLF